jgi:exopolysaccharide production protein ExoY
MEEVNNMEFEYRIRHIPIKRAFDILFSAAALVIGAPLFFLIALLTFSTSGGRVFYSHERLGRGAVPFKCYKFRSMYADADERLQEILANDPQKKAEWEKSFKLKEDPRITPIGAYLRKTSLDELPQFWNVLKGDLSIVGPRPVVQAEVNKYFGVKAYKILSVRPGITGPWQVSGRSNIECYQKRIELDEYYVDNQSLLLDIKLIAKTIPAIVFSKGAY